MVVVPVNIIAWLVKALASSRELSTLKFVKRSLLDPRLEDNDPFLKQIVSRSLDLMSQVCFLTQDTKLDSPACDVVFSQCAVLSLKPLFDA